MEMPEPFTLHYHRPLEDYDGWTLWTWDDLTERHSREIAPAGRDDYGLFFQVNPADYGTGMAVGVLPKKGDWQDQDGPDRTWTPATGSQAWILSGRPALLARRPDTRPCVAAAFLDSPTNILARLSHPIPSERISPALFGLRRPGGLAVPIESAVPGKGPGAWLGHGVIEVKLTTGRPLDPSAEPIWEMELMVEGYRAGQLLPRHVLDGPGYSSHHRMGAVWSAESTTFRVFAPTAAAVTVNLYREPQGGAPEKVAMTRAEKGLWEVTVPGNLNGRYYTLSASGGDPRLDPDREVIDPYSRCNTAHDGRGMVLHDTTPVADRPAFPVSEAIIYEMHIRDFSIWRDSGIRAKGKYLGVAEGGTHLPGDPSVTTGLDHLVELGVNVVQIMPLQDFDNDESGAAYNWGYMPVHFNSPDGWYASRVDGPARVVEVKQMIDALHRRGIRVVMDVVYNHTAETEGRVFSFNGLVPGYYYRTKNDGTFWNGSGTGNEFRSEAPMARKFILDSLEYWANEYKVDGFRFDLMGLIDTQAMIRIVRSLRSIDPNLLIYGEPWTGGATPIRPTGKGTQRGRGFGCFGDGFRDALKGGVFDGCPGYVQAGGRVDAIRHGLEGSIRDFAQEPTEVVNYVECHDNQTLWDRLQATTAEMPGVTDEDRVKMDRMAAAAILLAQGIPFIQCGQEMLRSKKGESNSYNKPDRVNAIRWSRKREHADVVAWYRGLIELRKAHPMFRMATGDEVREHLKWLDGDLGLGLPWNGIGFQLTRGRPGDSWEAAVVLFNPEPNAQVFPLPPGDWAVQVDGTRASGGAPLRGGRVAGQVELAPRTVMVLAR